VSIDDIPLELSETPLELSETVFESYLGVHI
jgi:hypothetical protein